MKKPAKNINDNPPTEVLQGTLNLTEHIGVKVCKNDWYKVVNSTGVLLCGIVRGTTVYAMDDVHSTPKIIVNTKKSGRQLKEICFLRPGTYVKVVGKPIRLMI